MLFLTCNNGEHPEGLQALTGTNTRAYRATPIALAQNSSKSFANPLLIAVKTVLGDLGGCRYGVREVTEIKARQDFLNHQSGTMNTDRIFVHQGYEVLFIF